MATERIIGVDFGTSTSVIRVKRYQDGQPVGDPLEVKQVSFNQGNTMVPTLVQKRDSGETVFFGCDAEIPHRGTQTYGNFKVDLESADADVRSQARALTKEFFVYLAKTYKTQSEGGHLGESSDQERTIISYPVKWSEDTKAFMLETAKAAGFPNVEGLDEAQAAIQAVTVQNADMLTRKGYFKAGVPVNILLIDMGAGTTDLVLCRHTPGTKPKTEILCTWPQKGTALFGGHEVDELLKGIICDSMPEDSVGVILKKLGNEKFKAWKESVVSPALMRKETVKEFAALDDLIDLLDIEAEYSLSRDSFEAASVDYLRFFPELVNGCLEEAKVSGDEVELVILTGGHSQWYFVQEMLRGEMPQFGSIVLSKVQQEPERIIPIALPQETVALGLVYGKLTPIADQPKPHGADAADRSKTSNAMVSGNHAASPKSNVMVRGTEAEARAAMQAKAHGAAIACGKDHTVGLNSDGTVVVTGSNKYGQCNVSSWRDIIAVAAGDHHTVGLKSDGTVVATGFNEDGQCDVSSWRNIIAVAGGDYHTVGLKSDGTVVAVGCNTKTFARLNKRFPKWETTITGQCNVSRWHDIIAVAAGDHHTVGLKSDGTVVATGDDASRQCNVSRWYGIIAVAAGSSTTFGLRNYGTLVTTTNNDDWHYGGTHDWQNIITIAVGQTHMVGLRSDGTVVKTGFNEYGQCNVSGWHDIIAVAAGVYHTVGLKSDGTVVATGKNEDGQCNVQSWKLF